MRFYEKQVDCRSKNAMVSYLEGHFRYRNGSSTYANQVKIHQLGLPHGLEHKAYDFLSTDYWDEISAPIDEFTSRHHHQWTICSSGRSGGYLELRSSHLRTLQYKSRCRSCGQLNYKATRPDFENPVEAIIAAEILKSQNGWRPEVYLGQSSIQALKIPDAEKLNLIRRLKAQLVDVSADNRCGRCGQSGEHGRRNLERPITELAISCVAVDEYEDFQSWSMSSLRERVRLIQDFDRTCDQIRMNFIDMIESAIVVEETVFVPKTVQRIQYAGC